MKLVKQLSKIIFYVVFVCIFFYSIFMCTQKLFWKDRTPSFLGYKNFIVLTGSMEPVLHVGDIAIVKETDDIKENDIISFKSNDSVITHRVFDVYKENEKEYYITKGDANLDTDLELLDKSDVEGKYFFKISFLGKIILFLQKPIVIIILFVVLGLFLLINSLVVKRCNESK